MPANERRAGDLPACCQPVTERQGEGLWWGLFYGLVPHTFCILFIVASVVGATLATSVLQRVLYVPYLFEIIIALSVVCATLSAVFYLRRNGLLSWRGARRKWRYLTIMYGTTLAINVAMFWVVFPAVANLDLTPRVAAASQGAGAVPSLETVTLAVDIPCPGHAPLIIGELKGTPGVQSARYQSPNLFQVEYDGAATTVEQILAQPVFEAFPAEVQP